MVQELLLLMPRNAGQAAMIIAIAGCALGLGLWLLGARYSRAMVALVAVAVGGVVGMMLPRYCGWTINPQATAVGGAVVLGLSGWMMHRVWVGLGLGLVLAMWAALGTWIIYNDPAAPTWVWPSVAIDTTVTSFATEAWAQVPDEIRKLLPYACGGALLTGLAATLLWPKLGTVLLYSCIGLSLLIGMGLAVIGFTRPQWLTHPLGPTWAQLTMLAALIGFGAVAQWNGGPVPTGPAGGGRKEEPSGAAGDPAINEILRKS